MKKNAEKYTITFVGATSNQAQAINGVIQAIKDLKAKDELPMNKYQGELKKLNVDYNLFKEVHEVITKDLKNIRLVEKVKERLDYYENEIGSREHKIANHIENMTYIDNYITSILSHIHEVVNKKTKTVVYTYDMIYFGPFLDLAVIVFEVGFDKEEKKELVN